MNNNLHIKGKVQIIDTKTREVLYEKDNLVVNTGIYFTIDRLASDSISPISHIAIGTDTTTAIASDTVLGSESVRYEIDTISTPSNILHIEQAITTSEALFNWKELGLFNASSAGVMISRVNVDYDHSSGGNKTIVWEITLTGN